VIARSSRLHRETVRSQIAVDLRLQVGNVDVLVLIVQDLLTYHHNASQPEREASSPTSIEVPRDQSLTADRIGAASPPEERPPRREKKLRFPDATRIDARTTEAYKKGMERTRFLTRHRLGPVAGLLGPLGICALLVPFRSSFPNTDAALVLVATIVAIAAFGSRLGGVLAAISSGVWFDFFLTKPYEHFSITARDDIETTVLLFVVGMAVTELAVWGRGQQQRAGVQQGYLTDLHTASEAMANGGSPTRIVNQIADELTRVLDLQACHFHFGSDVGGPRLNHDGSLTWGTTRWDIDNEGLPATEPTELLVSAGGAYMGRFLMTPRPGSRPTLTQRLVAVSLADQVGAALAAYEPISSPHS
jgi:hypothetical protein